MKYEDALYKSSAVFSAAGIDEAHLEAELLLRHASGLTRAELFRDLNLEINEEALEKFKNSLKKRLSGVPSAYITGHREFFGIDYIVTPSVLIPRPETELLVETAISLINKYNYVDAADIGTGSGNIAISLAVWCKKINITAVDISKSALDIAYQNARKHGVDNRISFLQGNLCQPLNRVFDLICANLPYVTSGEVTSSNLLYYEPHLALDGGKDGLDIIRELGASVFSYIKPGGSVLLEVGDDQSEDVLACYLDNRPHIYSEVVRDLGGKQRLLHFRLTP